MHDRPASQSHIQIEPTQDSLPRFLRALLEIDRLGLEVDGYLDMTHRTLGLPDASVHDASYSLKSAHSSPAELLDLEELPDALAVEYMLARRDDGVFRLVHLSKWFRTQGFGTHRVVAKPTDGSLCDIFRVDTGL